MKKVFAGILAMVVFCVISFLPGVLLGFFSSLIWGVVIPHWGVGVYLMLIAPTAIYFAGTFAIIIGESYDAKWASYVLFLGFGGWNVLGAVSAIFPEYGGES